MNKQKAASVAGFAPWEWVIGSGIYIDDVDAIFWNKVKLLGVLTLCIMAGIAFLSWIFARNYGGPSAHYEQ